MKSMIKLVLTLVLLLAASPAPAVETPQSFADLVDKLLPAVVNISTTELVKGQVQTPPGAEVTPADPNAQKTLPGQSKPYH